MKYLIILFLLSSCGWKPLVSCEADFNKETLSELKDSCIEQPQLGVMKKF